MDPKDKSPELSFSEVLNQVMDDPNYLVAIEPEGSGWDFSGWNKVDFTEVSSDTWIEAEKLFNIPSRDSEGICIRIIRTDPSQTKLGHGHLQVRYILQPIHEVMVPPVVVATDSTGKEIVLAKNEDAYQVSKLLTYYFVNIRKGVIPKDTEESLWGLFLKNVLQSKQILPVSLHLQDEAIQKETILAELQATEQDVLSILGEDSKVTI